MILNKHDLEDDFRFPQVDISEAVKSHCDWCGEPVADFDRFCPATECRAAYFEACREDGDPAGHKQINQLYRNRRWA